MNETAYLTSFMINYTNCFFLFGLDSLDGMFVDWITL